MMTFYGNNNIIGTFTYLYGIRNTISEYIDTDYNWACSEYVVTNIV